MGKVSITVNEHQYMLACRDGEEEQLEELAAFVDEKVAGLVENVGQIGEARLLLMTALLIADELRDAESRTGTDQKPAARTKRDGAVTRMLTDAATRIEEIAETIERT